jgi:hypothetical protein
MGWQLIPTGIGWREFSKTLSEGSFECANERCKMRRDLKQPFRMRQTRNWITVLFIPIIPLNIRGVYVECKGCKTVFPPTVLTKVAREAIPVKSTEHGPQPTVGAAPEPIEASVASAPGGMNNQGPPIASPIPLQIPSPSLTTHGFSPEVTYLTPLQARKPLAPIFGRVVFDDGKRIELRDLLVIGRQPSIPQTHPQSETYALDDPTRTVSKTHFVIGVDTNSMWIEDLGSANGVVIKRRDFPDQFLNKFRAELLDGATIHFGDRWCRVSRDTDQPRPPGLVS